MYPLKQQKEFLKFRNLWSKDDLHPSRLVCSGWFFPIFYQLFSSRQLVFHHQHLRRWFSPAKYLSIRINKDQNEIREINYYTLSPHFSAFFSSISWLCCIGDWHGPHQVAHTSIRITYCKNTVNTFIFLNFSLFTSPA